MIEKIRYKFVGAASQSTPPIPARDLSDEDFERLSPALQARVMGSELYEEVQEKPVRKRTQKQKKEASKSSTLRSEN